MENQSPMTSLDTKQEIKRLEMDLKAAFKDGKASLVRDLANQIQHLEVENKVAKQFLLKLNEQEAKEKAKAKAEKVKEYEAMLKKLFKEKDYAKVKALAEEFKTFDSESKSPSKWILKAEKQIKKAQDKKEGKGFFSFLFKKKTVVQDPISTTPQDLKVAPSAVSMASEKSQTAIVAPTSNSALPDLSLTSAHVAPKPTPIGMVPPAMTATPTAQVLNPMPKVTPAPTPQAPQPVLAVKPAPVTSTPPVSKPVSENKGNTFTKIFGKTQDATSIVDRIVAKVEKKKAVAPVVSAIQEKKPFNLLRFSRILMNFTAVFIIMTGSFLYLDFVDRQNTILGFVGLDENTGSKLHKASLELEKKKKEETQMNKDIAIYKGGYADVSLKTVDKIVESRVNWPDVFTKINEVTNSVYELNDFFKYVEYSNYSFDAEKGAIRVAGTLSDPQGRNLTKLVELEEAFQYFPRDKNNAEDPTKPYFKDVKEMTSFTKSLDQTTGRYVSNFQLSFSLNQ